MPYRFPNGLPAVLPATVAQIERRLPAAGEILVRMGSRVEPDDLIGRCTVQGAPVLLDVAGALGVEVRDARRRVRRQVGQRIAFRDVVARRGGRSVLAPFPGTVTAVDEATGFVVLTPDPLPASVTAAVRGYVVDFEPNRSATIETPAAVVQGAFGFGGEQWGVVRLLVTDPGSVITPDMIDARSAFMIVVGGAGITAEALRKARKEQVKGIVVGSLDEGELRGYWGDGFDGRWNRLLRSGDGLKEQDDGPTLLVTEGWGSQPMSSPLFDLLTRFDRQEAHLDGTTRLGVPETRPRLILPIARLPGGTAASPSSPFRAGAIVRVLDEAHRGRIGRVESIHEHFRLPSGVRTRAATVRIGEAERIVLPDMAIEIIG